MVLDALASYVGNLLTQVGSDELWTMLGKGIPGEIDEMGDKLRDLKNFLADADRRSITDQIVQRWVGQLKYAMYEATDILDLCQLKAMERESSSMDAGCFNPLLLCMRNPSHAHEIGTRIKALNKRLDDIKKQSVAFGFNNLGCYEDRRSSEAQQASRHGGFGRETSPYLHCSGLVGEKIEEDTRALVARIRLTGSTEVSNNIMVVAIVGVSGVGKTTLAQKVFNDKAIQYEFSKKIWLSISQSFNRADLLKTAIAQVGGDFEPAGNSIARLHETLTNALVGHKTLLVMDDMWNCRAWESVLKTHLVNAAASGNRVIITTRDEGVARSMRATPPYHHVDTLAPDAAWSLLKMQVLLSEIDEDHINTLKDIGLKIIKKCGGVPLAIKAMGHLLLRRGALRRDWEHVLNESKLSMPEDVNHSLYLSYEDLPPYLKQCFLYYSILPRNREFSLHEVVAMWIGEGFIHGNDYADLEEHGRNYYNELISRNLIEPSKLMSSQCYCRMTDSVRSFAQSIARDEALIAQEGGMYVHTKLSSQMFLRLSIETYRLQSGGELDWKSFQRQQSVRTLISTMQINMGPGDSLVTFPSLRTLHIEFADVHALVKSLHQLKHLRYLTLVNDDISVLPANIGKMKLLQFLDLHGCRNLVNLPHAVVKLSQLRYLGLASLSRIPRGLCNLTSMRKLNRFRAYMDGDWCSLDELGPLSRLVFLSLLQLENVSDASFAANARLDEKTHLTDLFLHCTSRLGEDGLVREEETVYEGEQQRIEKVFDGLCPAASIKQLNISGYFGQRLPCWITWSLGNLESLMFSDLACCTQLPNGLCQLPYLKLLHVRRAPCISRVGTGFLQATMDPFPRLNEMVLEGMVEWEEKVQAMTRLEDLFLRNCKLRCFPPGLASNAWALKKIVINDVSHLSYIEKFPSVVELTVMGSSKLERITSLPNLQKLTVTGCPMLKVLESVPALDYLSLQDYTMEKLPEYMRGIKPKHLLLHGRLCLLASLAAGKSGLEWDKFSHMEQVEAYADDEEEGRKWYVLYTRDDNCKLDSNITSHSTI